LIVLDAPRRIECSIAARLKRCRDFIIVSNPAKICSVDPKLGEDFVGIPEPAESGKRTLDRY
jgi:hypothetical protein